MSNVTEQLQKRLETLSPTFLEIVDDSQRHAGHAAVRGLASSETHFVVRIAFAPDQQPKNRIEAHRRVFQAVGDLLNNPIHALNIELVSPKT